ALLFALIFTSLLVLHAPLLRLPYFWDEAGYFVPAARDLLLIGDPIPQSTLSNAHPPLVMAWLALCWKLAGYAPAVTRTAMLVMAAFALLGVYRLALQVCWKRDVAVAATACVALYPVFFLQSAMAHLDVAAAAFTIWGLSFFLRGRAAGATVMFALAALAKETAILTPLALVGWELVARWRDWPSWPDFSETEGGCNRDFRFLWLLLAVAPLAAWFGYHWMRTGHVFGNPEYLRYNVAATLDPERILLAALRRLWQTVGHMNLFVLTAAAGLAMGHAPLREGESLRRRISFPVQRVFAVVIGAHVMLFSALGGAPGRSNQPHPRSREAVAAARAEPGGM
ncbi:MAG: ArnT family glycosyltransferase, partial [Terriglobales bacterium]